MGAGGRNNKQEQSGKLVAELQTPRSANADSREDDGYEDGDIATAKRDRHGPDDEPL